MKIEFGYVQEYNTLRGFGFVSRTFENANRKHRKNVWFHITKVKRDYPDVAKELDTGSFTKINFWYEVDNSDSERVSNIWLDAKDIPKQQRDSLVAYIEKLWCDPDNALPEWLDSITLILVGQVRKNELKQLHDQQISQHNKVKKQEHIQKQSQAEQVIRGTNQALASKDPVKVLLGSVKNNQIPLAENRFRAERGVIEAIFSSDGLHGLPLELKKIIRLCPRRSRRNPLSHKPGGSDVVVAYSLGDAILYDWIKNVDLYISSFEREDPGFHLHIESIYGRFYEDESERRIGVFCTIWNRDKDGTFQDAIKACVERYQRQMDISHKTLHQKAKEYWRSNYGLSEQEVENLPTLYKQYMKEKRDSRMALR